MIFNFLESKPDYPNARRVDLVSPNVNLLIEAHPASFNLAIARFPEVLSPLLFNYVSNGRGRKIYDLLSKLDPDRKSSLVEMTTSSVKETTVIYVFQKGVPIKEMKPLLRESLHIPLKVQKGIPYDGRLKRSYLAKSDKRINELMDLLQQLQQRTRQR